MHAVAPAGRLLVQHRQAPGRLVDPICRRLRPVAVSRVETSLLAIDDEKRRIGEILQQLNQRPGIRLAVAAIDAEAFTVTPSLAGEAADVHEVRRARLTALSSARLAFVEAFSGCGCRSARDRRRHSAKPHHEFATAEPTVLHMLSSV